MIKVATLLLLVGSIQGCFYPMVSEFKNSMKIQAYELNLMVSKNFKVELGQRAYAQSPSSVPAKKIKNPKNLVSRDETVPLDYVPAPEVLPEPVITD